MIALILRLQLIILDRIDALTSLVYLRSGENPQPTWLELEDTTWAELANRPWGKLS